MPDYVSKIVRMSSFFETLNSSQILGKIESPYITHAESIQLAHHMDMLRRAVGVVFDVDEN